MVIEIDAGDSDPAQALRREWAASLAEHLEELEVTRKELQRRLADHGVTVSQQAIGQWLRAETAPRPHHQAVIAKVLGVPVHRLFSLRSAA